MSAWHDLVLRGTPAAPAAATFAIYVFHDPLYKHSLVLATNLVNVQPQTVCHLYRDRWPVEQPPLAAKQTIGLHRQFVFALASCCRLPELSLLVGAILSYLAAVLPPVPSGFGSAIPNQPQEACVAGSRKPISQLCSIKARTIAKRTRLRRTCPKVSTPIAAFIALPDL